MRHLFIGCYVILAFFGLARANYANVSDTDIKNGLAVAKELTDLITKKDFTATLTKLAGAVGPYLGIIGPIFTLVTGLLGGTTESPELKYMKYMMKQIDARFDHVDSEFADLSREIDRVHTQILFGSVENDIHTVSTSLQDFYNAPINAVNGSRRYFIAVYDQNYNGAAQKIYDGFILDNNVFSQNLASSAMSYSQNDRHKVQTFMLGLLKLFLQAIKMELAYLKIKGESDALIEYRQQIWESKILTFKSKMANVDQSIASNYHAQTGIDLEKIATDNSRLTNEDFANKLYNFLITKYYWRDWMVIVYDPITGYNNHHVKECYGYIKFRFHGRNLVVSSVDKSRGTRPTSEKNSILSSLDLRHFSHTLGRDYPHSDADRAYRSFPSRVRDQCSPYASVGAIRFRHNQFYRGLPNRLTVKEDAYLTLHMFD